MPPIQKRLIFHIGGYDATPPQSVNRRFVREMERFESTWSVRAQASEPEISQDQAHWRVDTSGPNWQVSADVRFVRWDDVISAASARPVWRRVPLGLFALMDFFAAGAVWRYLGTGWRYALFYIYPAALLAGFALVAAVLGWVIAAVSASTWTGIAGAVIAFALLLHWPGRQLHLHMALDDWDFSRAYVRHGHPVLDARLDRLAADLVAAEGAGYDEILIIGHSLGAVLAVHLLDRALQLDSELGRRGPPVAFLAVGSSILKIGLHRRATALRAAVERVSSAPGVFWGEYQALSDVMNFYKTDPVRDLGLRAAAHPVVRTVSMRSMLDQAAYRRIKRNFFRRHVQFVSGNTRRARYDYFMLVCGPLSAEVQVRSPDGAASYVAPDGALLERDNPHAH